MEALSANTRHYTCKLLALEARQPASRSRLPAGEHPSLAVASVAAAE